jgi:hypothetical protein
MALCASVASTVSVVSRMRSKTCVARGARRGLSSRSNKKGVASYGRASLQIFIALSRPIGQCHPVRTRGDEPCAHPHRPSYLHHWFLQPLIA